MTNLSKGVESRDENVQVLLGLVVATLRMVGGEIENICGERGIGALSSDHDLCRLLRRLRAVAALAELLKRHPSVLEQER